MASNFPSIWRNEFGPNKHENCYHSKPTTCCQQFFLTQRAAGGVRPLIAASMATPKAAGQMKRPRLRAIHDRQSKKRVLAARVPGLVPRTRDAAPPSTEYFAKRARMQTGPGRPNPRRTDRQPANFGRKSR